MGWMHHRRFKLAVVAWASMGVAACEGPKTSLDDARVKRYEDRMTEAERFEPAPVPSTIDDVPVALQGEVSTPPLREIETVVWLHVPDPVNAQEAFDKRLERTRFSETVLSEYRDKIFPSAMRYIAQIQRPNQVRLTLADVLRRALANNYQIHVESYNPAISTAQAVQAEAIFDAAFFANVSRDNTDRPQPFFHKTPAQQRGFMTDTTIVSGGIRKLLATGAAVTFSQQMTRIDNPAFVPTQFYPTWAQNFVAEIRQPTLRNFGIDFNRSQINIRKTQRTINEEAFRAKVIEILNNTERAYWELVNARRDTVITAELLAHAELTYSQVEARKDYDAYSTLLSRSAANVSARQAEFINVKNRIRSAEDQLLNLMNDPAYPVSAEWEIIPVDDPLTTPIVRDQFHEVETSLKRRPELIQARRGIDVARLQLGIAKNQALPQLDLIYRATFNGVGPNADRAFDQETGSNFVDQFVGLEIAWNFGERAERAGIRIAALQQSQAVATYKRALDDVITDCRITLRNLNTAFEQLEPNRNAVTSSFDNLRALQERQERKSPSDLDVVLNAQVQLAQSRRSLLQALVAYNQGIADVERAKGTLLEYDNVHLSERP